MFVVRIFPNLLAHSSHALPDHESLRGAARLVPSAAESDSSSEAFDFQLSTVDLPFLIFLGHLHLNRPSDQLSWRTPWRNVVPDISAAAAQTCSPPQGDSTQSEKRISRRAHRPRTQRQRRCARQRSVLISHHARSSPRRRFQTFRLCALCVSAVSSAFLVSCRLLNSLASLFGTRVLCFQYLADSLCKTPGVGVPPWLFLVTRHSPLSNAFVFSSLQIPFPATLLFAHPYKTPGVSAC